MTESITLEKTVAFTQFNQIHRQSDRSDLIIVTKLAAKQKNKPAEPLPEDALSLILIDPDEINTQTAQQKV